MITKWSPDDPHYDLVARLCAQDAREHLSHSLRGDQISLINFNISIARIFSKLDLLLLLYIFINIGY